PNDAFVAKYNSSGALQWVWQAGGGGAGFDFYWDVALDAQSNVYVAGLLGTNAIAPSGSGGAFVAKYDPAGVFEMGYSISPSPGVIPSILAKVCADSTGNVFLAGWYQGTATFGTNALQPQGYWNFFLTKLVASAVSSVPAITAL